MVDMHKMQNTPLTCHFSIPVTMPATCTKTWCTHEQLVSSSNKSCHDAKSGIRCKNAPVNFLVLVSGKFLILNQFAFSNPSTWSISERFYSFPRFARLLFLWHPVPLLCTETFKISFHYFWNEELDKNQHLPQKSIRYYRAYEIRNAPKRDIERRWSSQNLFW